MSDLSWLPSLIGLVKVQVNGVDLPRRETLNFIGAAVEDSPDFLRTDITAGGGGAAGTITNLDPLNPSVVRYTERVSSSPIAGVNETCAVYVRTSYANAGEAGTCGIYFDVPDTQLDTYGSAIKINHEGHGDACYISVGSTDGRGQEVARWAYGGGSNYISTYQTDKASGTIDNPAFEALFCSAGGPGAPTIPGGVTPGYGLFYANQASGKAFVARKFSSNVADGVPMFALYENNLADLRWATYNDGATLVSATPAANTTSNKTRNSPIIRAQGSRYNGGNQYAGGYFQFAFDTPDTITGYGFRFYTGILGSETLAFIVRDSSFPYGSGLDFNTTGKVMNCTAIGNYTGVFDIANAGPNVLARFDPTQADGETSMWLQRNVGAVTTLQRVTMGAADSGGTGFRCLRVAN